MMDIFIKEFPKQLKEAVAIGEKANLTKHDKPIHNITVLGMGGSGIGGDFAASFIRSYSTAPLASSKGYRIPAYVGENSLIIASSYSGNTEETLEAFEQALERGSKIVCLTSGGKLLERAKELGLDYIQVPQTGQPPRACLGYSFVQQLVILKFFGFAPANCIDQVKSGIAALENAQEVLHKEAKVAAKKMHGKFPVIYSSDRMEPVGLRFRQQLNENTKILCVHHVVPEMNHNELVGWRPQEGEFVALFFHSADDLERNKIRMATCKEIIVQYADVVDFSCVGESLIEQALYGVHYGDWISYEMALLRDMDPVEVKAIDYLKNKLAEAAL
jgi:glucose/mannose-6-phosphate isomerase